MYVFLPLKYVIMSRFVKSFLNNIGPWFQFFGYRCEQYELLTLVDQRWTLEGIISDFITLTPTGIDAIKLSLSQLSTMNVTQSGLVQYISGQSINTVTLVNYNSRVKMTRYQPRVRPQSRKWCLPTFTDQIFLRPISTSFTDLT